MIEELRALALSITVLVVLFVAANTGDLFWILLMLVANGLMFISYIRNMRGRD